MKKIALVAILAATAVSAPALAATDGTLSTTSSTGTLDVNVNIPKMVRVSGLNDLTINVTPTLLTEPFFSREDATDKFCVYSNDGASGAYSMKITGAGAGVGGAPFSLNGAGGALPYYMWSSDTTNEFKDYLFGQTTTYASGADGAGRRTTLNCSVQGNNASVKVGVNDADLIAAQAGTYSDTVTVTVSVI
jgi:hypothetical protein